MFDRSRPDSEGSDAEEKASEAGEDGSTDKTEASVINRKSIVTAAAATVDDGAVFKEVDDDDEDDDGGNNVENGTVVTQIDYVNYFIPFLAEITACPYYWGKIDR